MKKTRKIIAILLTVLTLMSAISAATPVFAAEVTELTENPETNLDVTETDTEEAGQNESEVADILYEDTSRRDEYTKHFVMSSGLRKAIKYSQPIHYKENDKWVDIDNTLEYNYDSKKYQNKSNSFKVQFDKQFNSEELFTIENKGYTMSWRYNGESLYTAFANGQIDKSANKNSGFDKYTHKTNGKIKYNKFESECSLEYVVTGTGVKENIILESYTGKNRFSFEVTAKNLEFIKNEDKSISVVNQTSEEIFYIPAPFMFDANNQYCYDVEYSVEHKKDKYIISIVADENWLENSDTKYPVTIDPVIETQKTKTAINTTFIASGNPNTNYDAMRDVYIGVESSDYEKCRALFKFDLPKLNSGDMVVSATLGMWLHSTSFYTTTMPDKQINAHIVTSSWNAENVTWNTKPLFDSNVSDYSFIKQSDVSGSIYEKGFDISRAVKEWYEGTTENNGIMIKADVEDGSDADVAARGVFWSDKYNGNEDLYPYIEITYRDNKGLESYWSYSSFGIGVAGTAHVNDYTGNLVYELPILSSISERAPLTLTAYFNNYCANEPLVVGKDGSSRTSIGKGFRLNLQQTVLPSTKYGLSGENAKTYPYVYTDADGTEHYIQKVTEDGKTVYKDEDGLGLTLTTELDANESGTYKITDKAHNKYYFNIRGNLFRIVDNNGNKINIQFKDGNTANGLLDKSRIDKITDGAGHTFTFYYYDTTTGNFVEYIKDNAGRTINFDVSGGLLENVFYYNGDEVNIVYENTTEGIINYIQSNKSYRINFDYTSISTGRRVRKVKEYGLISDGETVTDTENGQVITFDRSKYNTTVMRSCGLDGKHVADYSTNGNDDIITTIQFDNMGRAISQQMKFGSGTEIGAGSVAYTSTSDDETASGFKNKVSGGGATGKYVENLLYGGNAESLTHWSFGTAGSVDAKEPANSVSKYIGEKSIKLTINEVEAENGRCFYKQDFSNVKANTNYTLSAYVKTEALEAYSNADFTGAFIQIKGFDSNGNEVADVNSRSQILTEETDTDVNKGWRRLSCTVETTGDVEFLRCYLFLRNTKGSVCFDGIQLEKGSTVNDYNMLENAHFSYESGGVPTSWSGNSEFVFKTGENGVIDPEDLPSNNTYYDDIISKAVRMSGSPGVEKGIYQTVAVEGNPNDTYILSGWAKGIPVNTTFHTELSKGKDTETTDDDEYKGTALFEIGVKVKYSASDGSKPEQYKTSATFNTTITDWQCASVPIVLKYTGGKDGVTYDPTSITIILRYHNQENFVFFDKIMLVKDAASSYTYDKDGNLISASSNSEQKSNMEYENNNLTSYTDSAGFKTELSYEENTNNLNYTTSAKGVYTNYDYDSYGNITSADVRNKGKIAEATAVIKTTNDYSVEKELDNVTINAGAYKTRSFDANGNATHYTSDYGTGTPTKVEDAKGVKTTYEYYPTTNNKDFGKQKSVATGNSKVTYEYNGKQQINKIVFGNTTKEEYYFEYDAFGNVTQTKVGSQPLSTNTFKPYNGVLDKTEYGNGDSRRYTYNNFGQKSTVYVTDDGTEKKSYSWAYNDSGVNIRHTDYLIGLQYLFDYDSLGRLSKEEVKDYNIGSFVGYTEYGYDVRNNLTKLITNYGGKSNSQRYYYSTVSENSNSANYRKDNLPTKYKLYSNRYAIYDYDGINRLNQRKFALENTALYYNYIYKLSDRNAENEKTYKTTQVAEEYIGNDVYIYDYDVLGNITSIRTAERKSTDETTADFKEYKNDVDYVEYDYYNSGALAEVVDYSDESVKEFTEFNYDSLGNITKKYIYTRSKEDKGEVYDIQNVTYNYGTYPDSNEDGEAEAGWNNLLTSITTINYIEGIAQEPVTENIDYDAIGNPISYLGAILTWNGRQLTAYGKDNTLIEYTYDANGLRTSKTVTKFLGTTTVNGMTMPDIRKNTTKYYYVNGKLHYQCTENSSGNGNKLYFYYDSNGYLTGIEYNDTTYYPATNLRGDVVAIYNNLGNCLAKYEYDAWGNMISVTDANGNAITDQTHIANVNPIRYRGYYYDTETKWYYLQSRYYNPAVGRFLNADGYITTGQGVLSYNMFAYCMNNPVMYSDPSGNFSVFSLLIGAIVVGALATLSGCSFKPSDYRNNETMNQNCYTYAFDLEGSADPGDYSVGYKSDYSKFSSEETYSTEQVSAWVLRDMEYLGKSADIVSSPQDKKGDEIIIAMKVIDTDDGDKFDYHFAVQLKNGKWADKVGDLPSRYDKIDGEAIKWELNEYTTYDSGTVYFAVGD